jgi:hypothetical protein
MESTLLISSLHAVCLSRSVGRSGRCRVRSVPPQKVFSGPYTSNVAETYVHLSYDAHYGCLFWLDWKAMTYRGVGSARGFCCSSATTRPLRGSEIVYGRAFRTSEVSATLGQVVSIPLCFLSVSIFPRSLRSGHGAVTFVLFTIPPDQRARGFFQVPDAAYQTQCVPVVGHHVLCS